MKERERGTNYVLLLSGHIRQLIIDYTSREVNNYYILLSNPSKLTDITKIKLFIYLIRQRLLLYYVVIEKYRIYCFTKELFIF